MLNSTKGYSKVCQDPIWSEDLSSICHAKLNSTKGVLFENRPALYFCNYIFITAHKMYNFWFRIKDTVYFFIVNNNYYDSNIENIAP